MKLTALAAVMAGSASFLQVSAAPIRVLLVTSSVSITTNNNPVFERLRFGHPVPNQAGPIAWLQDPHAAGPAGGNSAVQHHRHCGGGRNMFHDRVKAKTLEIANFFRAAFGWPLKEPAFHHTHHHKGPGGKHGGPLIEAAPPSAAFIPRHGKFEHQATSFEMRFQPTLMALGLWEGKAKIFAFGTLGSVLGLGFGIGLRMFWVFAVVMIRNVRGDRTSLYIPLAESTDLTSPCPNYVSGDVKIHTDVEDAVAYVLGCGTGVLLRMFWVSAVVIIRNVRGNRTPQYTPVAVSAEDFMVPPPNYVLEDVKIPIVVEDVKSPIVVEEVKKTTEDESK